MFWNGDRWLLDEPAAPAPRPRGPSLTTRSIAKVMLAGVLVFTLLPLGSASASALTGKAPSRWWESSGQTQTVQESSQRITYRGGWQVARHPGYLGGKVRTSEESRAKARLVFNGSAIAWIGPVGPTRGKAAVYIDGRLVDTVNTHARSFKPSKLLFQRAWKRERSHSIAIVVKGTKGHPTVAVDAFVVRTGDGDRESVNSVRVRSVPALMTALADNRVEEIVVANGKYAISAASRQASNSLWIGSRFASRTRAVTVRAETRGGVTFDAGGGNMGGLSFNGGAHHQTWDGFKFANGVTSQTGVIMFGGYSGQNAPHDITLRNITVLASCHRASAANTTTDHAVYFSYALDTWRDILIKGLTVDASHTMGLSSGIHMDHGFASDAPNVPAHGVTVRNLTFHGNTSNGGQQAIILWKPSVHDWLFDGASIVNSGGTAVTFESVGAKNIVFKDIVSTNSHGFYSSMGANPPGVTFINDSWH